MTRSCLIILWAGAALLAAQPAAGQDRATVPIAGVLRDENGDRIPDGLGRVVTLTGVLTSDPRRTNSRDAGLVTLQDSSGAIHLFADTAVLYGRFRRGDRVRARGRLIQYNGQEELAIRQIERLGFGALPAPHHVLAAELRTEQHSGRLVQVEGELLVQPVPGSKRLSAVLRDRSGEIPVYLSSARLMSHDRFARRLIKGGPVTIVGVASQWDEAPPFDGDYRLMPRTPDDFVFHTVPPYRVLTVAALILALVLAVAHLWLRRQAADRALAERRQVEEALRRSEAQYRSLVENAPHGVFGSTREGRFTAVNPALVAMLGYGSAEELMAVEIGSQVFQDTRDRERLLQEWLPEGLLPGVEVRWRRKDGRPLLVRLTSRAVRGLDGGVHGFETFAEDVTERQALEQRLRQAEKMDAVGRLAGGVAHDFNNLLTVVLASSDMLLDGLRADDPLRGEAGEIKAAAVRAAGLTRQLLAFSRQQAVAPKVLDVNAVLGSMSVMLRRVIGEHIELSTVARGRACYVKADPSQLEQVVLNLALNARDAMPDGGRLVIEVAEREIPAAGVPEGPSLEPGRFVTLSVTDTGVGMASEVLSHVFEPFFTTKEVGRGTGLGLATVYGIVKQSGGHIQVQSEPGRGSIFTIYLPCAAASAEPADADAVAARSAQGSETILLVEDEGSVRELVRRALTKQGYAVLAAADGAEAVGVAAQYVGPIHAVVTDVVMPRMNGRKLAQALALSRPETKLLFMSGYNDDAVLRQGLLEDGMAFLQKPFTPDTLARALRDVLDGSAARMQTCCGAAA